MCFVYVLKSKRDGSVYVGKTRNIEKRLAKHNLGCVAATKASRPFEVVSYFAFCDDKRADNFERYLKAGSGRAFLRKHVL